MFFTRNEKLAIFGALDAILLADGRAHSKEVDLISEVNVQFNFFPSDMDEARKMDPRLVMNTLVSLSSEKKEFFKRYAVRIAEADGKIDDNELRLISLFFAML